MSVPVQARRRFELAAIALAAHVSIVDHIRTDPSFPADRRPEVEPARERMFQEALAEFRAAEAAFQEAVAS